MTILNVFQKPFVPNVFYRKKNKKKTWYQTVMVFVASTVQEKRTNKTKQKASLLAEPER